MWERYKPAVIVAGLLFLVSAVAGLIAGKVVSAGGWSGGSALVLIGLIMVVATFIWSRQFALVRVVPDVLLAVSIACLFYVALAPLITELTASGKWRWGDANPFVGGPGLFFEKIWLFYGAGLAGAAIGYMITVAIGQDQRTKALKRFSTQVATKPHRPVRR